MTQKTLNILFKILEIHRALSLLGLHGIKSVISISKLNYLFPITGSHGIVVHHTDILNQLYQPSLHISSISCLYCSIDYTLTPSHCMEKELSGS